MTYAQDIVAGRYKIPISMLNKQAYCEYQIFLEHVKGVTVAPTAAMQKGTEFHTAYDLYHQQTATEEMSLEDALSKSKERKVTLVARDVEVENSALKGRIDEIEIGPAQITIIDDKPTNGKVWQTDIRQVWGYCWAYTDQYKPDRPLYGAIKDHTLRAIVWREPYTDRARTEVEDASDRIMGILKGERVAIPTKFPAKCKKCRFKLKQVCDKAL